MYVIPFSAMLRVRQIIASWDYPTLRAANIVPDMESMIPALVTKRYPPWVYGLAKQDSRFFSTFGLFMESLAIAALRNNDLSVLDYGAVWKTVSDGPMPEAIPKAKRYFEMLLKGILKTQPMLSSSEIQQGYQLQMDNVTGHPDLVDLGHGLMVEIKTTSNFKKMSHQAYLQLLSYCALARVQGLTIHHIGFLFILQRQWTMIDLSNWDSTQFLMMLLRDAEWCLDDYKCRTTLTTVAPGLSMKGLTLNGPCATCPGGVGFRLHSSIVGAHVAKPTLESKLQTSNGRPLQVFLSNPRGKSKVTAKGFPNVGDCSVYVHAPYIINLCHVQDPNDPWDIQHLKDQLTVAASLKCKGVVVHMGKSMEANEKDALQVMKQNLIEVLASASPACPLMLETPCGVGTEVLSTIESFFDFYESMSEFHDRLKCCVDSCHVLAAAYDPLWYLEQWHTRFPGAVTLVHFNDSMTPRGSRVDRHASAGLGFIGWVRMAKLHEYCVDHDIPMVVE